MRTRLTLLVALAAAVAQAQAPDIVTYPAQGQSAEQQHKDRDECNQWAMQTAGTSAATAAASAASVPSSIAASRSVAAARLPALPTLPTIPGLPAPPRPPELSQAQANTAIDEAWQQLTPRQQRAGTGETHGPTYVRALAACMAGRGYAVK
ncbi:hypothetical protein PEC18_31285 [Paucibacter sp. O1-1]|nr:hypothetical protein [Paucibacter sp. O1-1]MDA3830189.1 hypothetical protein [Paucibacter sp. O1-1]